MTLFTFQTTHLTWNSEPVKLHLNL